MFRFNTFRIRISVIKNSCFDIFFKCLDKNSALFTFQCTYSVLTTALLLYHKFFNLSIPFFKLFLLFRKKLFSKPPSKDNFDSLTHLPHIVNTFFRFFLIFLNFCIFSYYIYLLLFVFYTF